MKKKGYTLVEVILAISLIGLISVVFLPVITSGYNNIIRSKSFTETLFEDQEKVENKIEELQKIDPDGTNIITVYGKNIKGHNISIATNSGGVVNFFLPKKNLSYDIPIIQSHPVIEVRQNNSKVIPQPIKIDLMDETLSLFVDEITITNATEDYYLMSAYRWYMSAEMDISVTSGTNPNEYFILKEWNEAKKQLSFLNSLELKYIPNIKEKYNQMIFKEIKDGIPFNDESFINSFGNRYIRYGVTPFSLIGRIGTEKLSDAIYVEAPRIKIEKAEFAFNQENPEDLENTSNEIHIFFNVEITDDIDMSNIRLNEKLGIPFSVYRHNDSDKHHILVLKFDDLDNTVEVEGNKLVRGAVRSKDYGSISIWKDNIMEGEFTIIPQP